MLKKRTPAPPGRLGDLTQKTVDHGLANTNPAPPIHGSVKGLAEWAAGANELQSELQQLLGRNAKLLAQPLDELNPHSAGAASETQHASPGSKGAVVPTEPAEVIDSTGEQSHSHATASPPLTADSRVPAKRHVGCGDIPEEEPPEHVVCGSAHYGKEHGKGLAWQVRPDGSAMAQWPGRRNQALAVSVDKEGRRFRLYAAYKDKGTMAVSFDGAGNGVVNTKSGKVCFQHNSKRGGFCIDANTGAKQVWASGDLPNANVDIQLDETLGFRFDVTRVRAEVYFQYAGIRHKFVQGYNDGGETEPDSPLFKKPSPKRSKAKPPELPSHEENRQNTRSIFAELDALNNALNLKMPSE